MATKELKIIVDTREQRPFDFPPEVKVGNVRWFVSVERGTLPTGDYAIQGYGGRVGEHWGICIERKQSFSELGANVGKERDRFVRELLRMSFYQCRAIIVCEPEDAAWSGQYRGLWEPKHMLDNLRGLCEQFQIPIFFNNGREDAARHCLDMLRRFAAREELCATLDERRDPKDPRDQPIVVSGRMWASVHRRLANLEVGIAAIGSDLATTRAEEEAG
jgi:ERCC4-type nuclease